MYFCWPMEEGGRRSTEVEYKIIIFGTPQKTLLYLMMRHAQCLHHLSVLLEYLSVLSRCACYPTGSVKPTFCSSDAGTPSCSSVLNPFIKSRELKAANMTTIKIVQAPAAVWEGQYNMRQMRQEDICSQVQAKAT